MSLPLEGVVAGYKITKRFSVGELKGIFFATMVPDDTKITDEGTEYCYLNFYRVKN